MHMKIFAFSTDDRGLEVFSSKEEAISYCEAVDIENGEWIFWDEFGISMEVKFYTPNQKVKFSSVSGKYDLVPFPKGLELIEFLSNVDYVEGRGMFGDVSEVRQHLTRQARRTR
jgi:hypothetical protein